MKSIKKQLGMTFLELMVVVGIIAVLSMVAIPSYQKYVLRLNRIEARNTMDTIAQRLEQNFSITRDFTHYYDPSKPEERAGTAKTADEMMTSLGYSQNYPIPANRPNYEITLSYIPAPTSSTPTGEEIYGPGFRLVAIAVGKQQKDRCGAFYLNHRNVRKAANPAPTDWGTEKSRSPLATECWQS